MTIIYSSSLSMPILDGSNHIMMLIPAKTSGVDKLLYPRGQNAAFCDNGLAKFAESYHTYYVWAVEK